MRVTQWKQHSPLSRLWKQGNSQSVASSGGSLGGQPTAHLIADAELDRLVRSLLHGIPQVPTTSGHESESLASAFSSRHHLRLRQPGPAAVHHFGGPAGLHREINPAEIDLEPGISVIAEKAQALTGATGAAIALRRGSEIVCRARTGRTAPDIGCRLQTDRGLSAECVRTGEVLLCPDTEFNPRVDLARVVTWECARSWSLRPAISAERSVFSRCFRPRRTPSTITMSRPCSFCRG